MRNEVINASDINEAAKRILQELKKDNVGDSRSNVIYFDGWDGLGASAVLRRVAKLLTLAAKAEEPVFHIDCSKWESRRAMQRMIAEQLKLPASMMEVFDIQDEKDDYKGMDKSSRIEIQQISDAIHQHIQKQYNKFLLIFHNGSSEEINLNGIGFPLFDRYSRSKVLWSFQGRFRAYPMTKIDTALKYTSTTDVFLSANLSDIGEKELSDILCHESEGLAHEMNAGGTNWLSTATNCFVYTMKLCHLGSDLATIYDLVTHVCNYWRCDGIIQVQQGDLCSDEEVDKLWSSYGAMHCEMRLDANILQNQNFSTPLQRCFLKDTPYWTSPTFGLMLIPDPLGLIPNCMFQQFDKLCVLKLSKCMFSFSSPPFLRCHNIRFLWLDHCRDGSSAAEAVKDGDIERFFQRLWVLDVRYLNEAFLTDEMMGFMTQLRELYVMGQVSQLLKLQGRMNNIHKLRVTKSRVENVLSGKHKLEFLEFSRNYVLEDNLFVDSSCSNLETVIICGSATLDVISLMGCAKLKNIFLSGLFRYLHTIEITGAAVETLDLRTVTAKQLDRLFLRACQNLCSILWSPVSENKRKPYLDKLHIDTSTQKKGDTDISVAGREFSWDISIRDARILQSLEPVKDYFGRNNAHVEVSSPTHFCGDGIGSKDKGAMSTSEPLIKENALYAGVAKEFVRCHSPSPAIMQNCPPPPNVPAEGCYIHVDDLVRKTKSQTTIITLPGFICDSSKILHVHDSLHLTGILDAPLASAAWNQLELCQVERCPNLECVFNLQLIGGPEGNGIHKDMFRKLRTTWASHLLNALYIWKLSCPRWNLGNSILRDMKLMHLDCCPRMRYIADIPAFVYIAYNLEILEITWCGDLSVAFHVSTGEFWYFPKLKHIRLHELPKLQNIGTIETIETTTMMPELETIKIRGCWSLRVLPVGNKKVVDCNCEKEWWDKLEWVSAEHRALYKPIHPRYYKKTMPKSSVLR